MYFCLVLRVIYLGLGISLNFAAFEVDSTQMLVKIYHKLFLIHNKNILFIDSGDNVDCWMEIQQGKGPWASPVNGIVPLGTTLTMVVGIDDKEGKTTLIFFFNQAYAVFNYCCEP